MRDWRSHSLYLLVAIFLVVFGELVQCVPAEGNKKSNQVLTAEGHHDDNILQTDLASTAATQSAKLIEHHTALRLGTKKLSSNPRGLLSHVVLASVAGVKKNGTNDDNNGTSGIAIEDAAFKKNNTEVEKPFVPPAGVDVATGDKPPPPPPPPAPVNATLVHQMSPTTTSNETNNTAQFSNKTCPAVPTIHDLRMIHKFAFMFRKYLIFDNHTALGKVERAFSFSHRYDWWDEKGELIAWGAQGFGHSGMNVAVFDCNDREIAFVRELYWKHFGEYTMETEIFNASHVKVAGSIGYSSFMSWKKNLTLYSNDTTHRIANLTRSYRHWRGEFAKPEESGCHNPPIESDPDYCVAQDPRVLLMLLAFTNSAVHLVYSFWTIAIFSMFTWFAYSWT